MDDLLLEVCFVVYVSYEYWRAFSQMSCKGDQCSITRAAEKQLPPCTGALVLSALSLNHSVIILHVNGFELAVLQSIFES